LQQRHVIRFHQLKTPAEVGVYKLPAVLALLKLAETAGASTKLA
jgi:hypothetical protein